MSKTTTENYSTFFSRIDKVLIDSGLTKKDGSPNYAKAEQKAGMAGTVLSKAAQRDGELSEYNKEKFLRTFHVNRDWLEAGKGEIYSKKPTPVTESTGSNENPVIREGVYQTIVEGHTEYVLIPRMVLNETQLISTEQINKTWAELAEKNKELERKNRQLDFYQEQFAKLMDNLELSPKSANPKEVK